jgi:hypothetical protein
MTWAKENPLSREKHQLSLAGFPWGRQINAILNLTTLLSSILSHTNPYYCIKSLMVVIDSPRRISGRRGKVSRSPHLPQIVWTDSFNPGFPLLLICLDWDEGLEEALQTMNSDAATTSSAKMSSRTSWPSEPPLPLTATYDHLLDGRTVLGFSSYHRLFRCVFSSFGRPAPPTVTPPDRS